MNDWRSTFGGVNDHEADWEQVTVFLPDPPDLAARPAWVAFSSHDETGDDLRRRQDDPDIEWRDTHPVVFAGAGSHSGAYLPGDYLITVEPPVLGRLFAAARRLTRLLLPWARERRAPRSASRSSITAGGTARPWAPVRSGNGVPCSSTIRRRGCVITGDCGAWTPAIRSAASVPRPGRATSAAGSVRLSWSDPVGWAGLDKVAPSAKAEQQAVADRHDRAGRSDRRRGRRTRRPGRQAARRPGREPGPAGRRNAGRPRHAGRAWRPPPGSCASAAGYSRRNGRRWRARPGYGLPPGDPHAHLRHRALPNVDPIRTRKRVLQAWSTVSASFLWPGSP